MGTHPRIEHKLDNLEDDPETTFEQFIHEMEQLRGQVTEWVGGVGDEGVDVLATGTDLRESTFAIQAKYSMNGDRRYGSQTVQQYGRLLLHHDHAAVYTNGEFTDDARSIAEKDGLTLVDGEQLANTIHTLGAEPILDKYYERPLVTTVDEMMDIIETLGRMERVSTEDNGTYDSFEPVVPSGKIDTPTRRSKKNRLPVYCDAIRGLFEFGFLDQSDLPVPVSRSGRSTRYLLNSEPRHSDGSQMKEPECMKLLPGVYLNHHDRYDEKLERLELLAELCVEKMTPDIEVEEQPP